MVYARAMPRSDLRVQFAHGLESSPQGTKARLLAGAFTARTPAMDTRHFGACVELHARVLEEFQPHVLVGSSFGGAVVVELLMRGLFRGPTLLLAQAAVRYRADARLPEGVPVTLVHAPLDEVVPFAGSEQLARTGTPGLVTLISCEDDHALTHFCARGALESAVEALDARAPVEIPVVRVV
jgi:predicted esterase